MEPDVTNSSSEDQRLRTRWVMLSAAFALAAGLIVGRFAGEGLLVLTRPADGSRSASRESWPNQPVQVTRYKIPVSISQPVRGPATALLTVVEWCDLRDRECKRVAPIIDDVLAKYGDQARLVYRHYIDPQRSDSGIASEFATIANVRADKFWQVHDLILHDERELTVDDLVAYSERVGMDPKQVRTELEGHTNAGHIIADGLFAAKFGVADRPALFVNGRRLEGAFTREGLQRLMNDELTYAKAVAAKGVPASDVYAELTKDALWGVRSNSDAP